MITVRYDKPKKLASIQSAFISFPFNRQVVDVLRSMPERVWLAKEKEWEIPFNLVSELEKRLPNHKFKFIGEPIDNSGYTDKKVSEVYTLPKELKTKLYDYQQEDYQILMNNDKFLLLWEAGLGKSLEVISVALKRRELGQINHCLIVCGVNTIKYTLAEEVKKHTGLNALVLGNRQNKSGMWNTQGTKEKLEDLEDLSEFFIITNVESLRNKDIKDKIKWHMDKGNIGMMVLDEAHKCRSSSSQQGKAMLLLSRHCPYVIAMTGTLLNNTPLDSYVPLRMVDGEKTNLSAFRTRYCIFGGFGNYQVVGLKNLEELQMKIDKHSVRRLKKDVLSLPPKIYTDEVLEMSKAQAKMYTDVLKLILKDIDKIEISPDPLSMLTRLRQVTADTSILSDRVHESVKLDRMVELVEEATEKVLVFSNWTSVTDRAVERLSAYNPAVITGKVKDRQSQIDKFMNDDTCKVCVCTIAAAGVGLTLTAADTCIFLDQAWTAAANEQAEDRCHRIGQGNSVNVINLICKGTIDEHIAKVVAKKRIMGEAIVDHRYSLNNADVVRYIITGEGDLENNA